MPPASAKQATGAAAKSKKLRPTSAAANMQSHPMYRSSMYDPPGGVRPVTAAVSGVGTMSRGGGGTTPGPYGAGQQRPKTQQQQGPKYFGKADVGNKEEAPQRRATVGAVDGIGASERAGARPRVQASLGQMLKGQIENKISIDTLDALKKAFASMDEDGSGSLDLQEFKVLLKKQLRLPASKEGQIDALFQKIDWSSDGAITWEEFCTYMQLEYAKKEEAYHRGKEVTFGLPATIKHVPHKEPILRITDTSDGNFMACSQEGLVSFWSPNMELKRQRSVQTTEVPGVKQTKTRWITDFTIMSHFNKFIVSTGDREIQFFELSSFEPYCQISSLETVPLKLDYSSLGPDECIILYGDGDGCVNIIHITSTGECLRMWKKAPKAEGMPSVGIDLIATGDKTQFIRWKVHKDWVQQMKYYHSDRKVISCSNNDDTALVIGCTMGSTDVTQQLKDIKDPNQSIDRAGRSKGSLAWLQARPRLPVDEIVFKVYKGVKCFHFSKKRNVLVTGGMDRIVRLWNPYVPGKSMGMLRGHNSPIFFLFIAEEDDRIFSISTDKCIKIWDIQDQNCLLTIRPKGHKIRGDLNACHYSSISKTLCVATDQINALPVKLKHVSHADIPITHKEPIHAMVYNQSFKQMITCSDGSVIKVWDMETGNVIFEYSDAHENEEGNQPVTALVLDNTNRRLISGGRDGCIKVWNYNNGHCLKTLMTQRNQEEITDLAYVVMSKNRYILSVGWDKRINIYNDSMDGANHNSVQHPMPSWEDDLKNGHREDILSVATAPPSLLATSSYDGLVIVWNLVSGHIFCRLRSPLALGATTEESLNGELSISKLLFLRTRAMNKDSGALVASGPKGVIHIWNVFNGGILRAKFKGTRHEGGMVSAMATNKDNTLLFTADSFGFIFLWNIDDYAGEITEDEEPELVTTWRGHIDNVTEIQLIEEYKVLATCSLDCTVRVWTYDGEYVGTFGQPEPWDIYNFATYQHPMVPYDVLVDPRSLPQYPLEGQGADYDSDSNYDSEEENKAPTPSTFAVASSTQVPPDQQPEKNDEQIAAELRTRPYEHANGKRLRHEKLKPIREDRGGPSEYRMLKCFDLEATPMPKPPQLKLNKNNPFDFYAGEEIQLYD